MPGELRSFSSQDRDFIIGQQEAERAAAELREQATILEARRIDAVADAFHAAEEGRVEDFLKATDAVASIEQQLDELTRRMRQARQAAALLTRIRETRAGGGEAPEQRAAA